MTTRKDEPAPKTPTPDPQEGGAPPPDKQAVVKPHSDTVREKFTVEQRVVMPRSDKVVPTSKKPDKVPPPPPPPTIKGKKEE